MTTWREPEPVNVPESLRDSVGGHRIVAESLVRRGFTNPAAAGAFLNPGQYMPASPFDLPDMDRAVERLQKAIRDGERILVWGDFDVDGQTSTALLVSGLREMGAQVTYHVPNRFTEGHGIHVPTLSGLLDGGVDLVLTCDTGITAHEAVSMAQERGVDVVITDHHALAETLPPAAAVVNPMRLAAGHPLRELPGVGTAYKLIQALYDGRESDHLLDLVAMGIVADVMVQVDDTRYLLQRGLSHLRETARPGLQALMQRAEIVPAYLTEMDIGFSLAPRLNAAGRLADAGPVVDLLTTHDPVVIAERVTYLESLNQQRRLLTRQVYEAAKQQIEQDESLLKYAVLVVSGEDWHPGVVGIVASRLVDDHDMPVIVLSEKDGMASGSARSVPGVNIIEAIRTQAALLTGYGGHSMAAGMRLAREDVFAFRRGLSSVVRQMREDSGVETVLQIDARVDFSEIDLDFAHDISRLAPFGNGNPALTLLVENVTLERERSLGSRGDHLELTLADPAGNTQRVLWWFGDRAAVPQGPFDLACTVRLNHFRGEEQVMIEWLDARVTPEQAISITEETAYEVLDYRQETADHELLARLKAEYAPELIYAEGVRDVDGVDRYHLEACETLLVWTVPAHSTLWRTILNLTQPRRLILAGYVPPFETADKLLSHITGMAKYAIQHRDGIITLADLTARTGSTDQTMLMALRWLHVRSSLRFVPEDDEHRYRVSLSGHDGDESEDGRVLSERLTTLLRETRFYRHHWLSVQPHA